jgi:enamine deaminase RidA (YjgF/YER057c/UK114 family)
LEIDPATFRVKAIHNQISNGDVEMPIERFMVPGMRDPVSHFCHVVKAGGTIWLSGMTGVADDKSIPESTVEQFRLAMASMDKALRHAGGLPDQVVKVLVFMTDINERPLINPLRAEYFGEHKPASSLVEVTGLVDPRMKVEIEAVAYIGD